MQLLSIKEIKEQKNTSNIEKMERIEKLKKEEKDIINSVNKKRDESKVEIEDIDKKVSDKKSEYEIIITKLDKEVSSLESRKLEALKPITEIKKEADNILENAKKTEIEININNKKVIKQISILVERTADLVDLETDLKEKKEDSNKRENKILIVEEENKKSSDRLSKSWLDFHKRVNNINLDIKDREQKIKNKEKTNNTLKVEMDIREKELDIKDRMIVDKYKSLQRARDEILGREE